jgi:hypothetical protein
MNWGKGFFRVWLLLSGLWVIGAGLFFWSDIMNPKPYLNVGYAYDPEKHSYVKLERYTTDETTLEGLVSTGKAKKINILSLSGWDGVLYYPATETAEQSEKHKAWMTEAVKPQYTALQSGHRRDHIWYFAMTAALPPLILLCFGAAIGWVLTGFRQHKV